MESTYTRQQAGDRVLKATLLAGEEISYFCSGKSVAPVSEAAKGEPRTIDRVRASFFVSSSRDSAVTAVLVLAAPSLPLPLSLVPLFRLCPRFFFYRASAHGHGAAHRIIYRSIVAFFRVQPRERLQCPPSVRVNEGRRRKAAWLPSRSLPLDSSSVLHLSPGSRVLSAFAQVTYRYLLGQPNYPRILLFVLLRVRQENFKIVRDRSRRSGRSVARIGGKCEAGGMLIVEGTRLVHGERSADFTSFASYYRDRQIERSSKRIARSAWIV